MKSAAGIALALTLALASAAHADDVAPSSAAPPTEPAAAPSATNDGRVDVPRGTASAATPVVEGSPVSVGGEIFARYLASVVREPNGTSWFHEVDVPRVHLAVDGSFDIARARIVLEAVRSGGEGSLVGVAGDSLVLRLREAFAEVAFWEKRITLRGGIVPMLSVPAFESAWRLRAVAATPIEEAGFAHPSDLGATATISLPGGYGWAGVSFSNGEGYTSRDLNRGKNLDAAIEFHPLASVTRLAPLAVFASYTNGSSGTGSARANRTTGGVLWRADAVSAGASFTYAWGLDDDATRLGYLVDAFGRAEIAEHWIAGLRVSHVLRNAGANDRLTTFVGAFGYRIVPPFEVFLAASHALPSDPARALATTLERTELSVVAHAAY